MRETCYNINFHCINSYDSIWMFISFLQEKHRDTNFFTIIFLSNIQTLQSFVSLHQILNTSTLVQDMTNRQQDRKIDAGHDKLYFVLDQQNKYHSSWKSTIKFVKNKSDHPPFTENWVKVSTDLTLLTNYLILNKVLYIHFPWCLHLSSSHYKVWRDSNRQIKWRIVCANKDWMHTRLIFVCLWSLHPSLRSLKVQCPTEQRQTFSHNIHIVQHLSMATCIFSACFQISYADRCASMNWCVCSIWLADIHSQLSWTLLPIQ